MVSQPPECAGFGCRPSYYRFNAILMLPAFHSPQSEHPQGLLYTPTTGRHVNLAVLHKNVGLTAMLGTSAIFKCFNFKACITSRGLLLHLLGLFWIMFSKFHLSWKLSILLEPGQLYSWVVAN